MKVVSLGREIEKIMWVDWRQMGMRIGRIRWGWGGTEGESKEKQL